MGEKVQISNPFGFSSDPNWEVQSKMLRSHELVDLSYAAEFETGTSCLINHYDYRYATRTKKGVGSRVHFMFFNWHFEVQGMAIRYDSLQAATFFLKLDWSVHLI